MPSELNRLRAVKAARLPIGRKSLYALLETAIAEYEVAPTPGKERRVGALAREYQERYGKPNGGAALSPAEALALAKLLRRVNAAPSKRTRNADRYYA